MINSGDAQKRTADILDMRNRLLREKPSQGPWDLKMRTGGLLDLEFITQHAILTANTHQALSPELMQAQSQLHETGIWPAALHAKMAESFELLQALQQVQRMANDVVTGEADLSIALKDRLCRAANCASFERLTEALESACQTVFETFCKNIGIPATET
jgi:glutamate-ammonia-ligase adenylyltransferase